MKELKILIKADGGFIGRFSMKVEHGMIVSITELTEQTITENKEWNYFISYFRETCQTFVRSALVEILDWSDWYVCTYNVKYKPFVHLYIYEGEIPEFYGNFNAYYK